MFSCGAVALLGAAVVLEPASIMGLTPPHPNAMRSPQAHREVAAGLVRLIENSNEVLAVHDRTSSPYAEVVLWLDDRVNPGMIDPQEVALISHSKLFRAVMAYSLSSAQDQAPAGSSLQAGDRRRTNVPPVGHEEAGGGDSPRGQMPTLDRELMSQSAFCDRWRALPMVQPRVIARGISDMEVERQTGPQGELSLLRLSLTWGSDSTDGASEVSRVIDLGSRASGPQE